MPYLRPGFVIRRILNPMLQLLGVMPVVVVRGRVSGRPRGVVVNVLEKAGARYLVAPRGDTQWARNLRAAGTGELRHRGKTQRFRAVELPDAEKPPLIDAYLKPFAAKTPSDRPRAFQLNPRRCGVARPAVFPESPVRPPRPGGSGEPAP